MDVGSWAQPRSTQEVREGSFEVGTHNRKVAFWSWQIVGRRQSRSYIALGFLNPRSFPKDVPIPSTEITKSLVQAEVRRQLAERQETLIQCHSFLVLARVITIVAGSL